MSVKEYRFFGQVQEVNDIGETTDAGWSVFCTWVKQEDYARLQAEVERSTTQYNGIIDTQLKVIDELKAEVERFKFTLEEERQITRQDWAGLRCEHDRVKRALEQAEAEVERLTERNKFLEQIDSYLQGANENAYEKRCDELEAEVERLRKAGDAMADAIKWLPQTISDHHQQAWNAAKEGKQS